MARTKNVKIRLSDEEMKDLDGLREIHRLSKADMFRFCTLGPGASDKLPSVGQLTRMNFELGKIGSNINQIARVANSTRLADHVDNEIFENLSRQLAKMQNELRSAIRR